MIFLFNILVLVVIGWWLCRQFYRKFGSIAIWGLLVKAIGASSLSWVYFVYYESGDTISLWQQLIAFNETASVGFTQYMQALFASIDPYQGNPRSVFFVRLMAPLGLLSQNSYVILTGYLCLFSYWTSWTLLDAFDRFYPKTRVLAMVAFCFLPTHLFWASGLLKDTLTNGALFYLTAQLITLFHGQRLKSWQWIVAVLLFGCLFMTRHYLAGLWSIMAIVILVDRWISKRQSRYRLGIYALFYLVGAYSMRLFFIRLRPERFPLTFHELHQQFQNNYAAGSNISFDLDPTWWSLISKLPYALWTGLFRPGLWEIKNLLQAFETLQTTMFLACFTLSIFFIRKVNSLPMITVHLMIFILALGILLPLAAPNLGSLSRYRIAFTPFLAFLVMYLPYRRFVLKDL